MFILGGINIENIDINEEKQAQKDRGKRIRDIRLELKMNKITFAQLIGVSGQFLGLVEEGRGNLVYKSIKKMRDISGYSADYILFGIDDTIINKTNSLLEKYSEEQIIEGCNILSKLALFMRDNK